MLAGVVGLLLSLLVRGPLSRPRLSLRIRPGSPDEPGRAGIKEAAAADVAAVLEDDRYFVPDAPGGGFPQPVVLGSRGRMAERGGTAVNSRPPGHDTAGCSA